MIFSRTRRFGLLVRTIAALAALFPLAQAVPAAAGMATQLKLKIVLVSNKPGLYPYHFKVFDGSKKAGTLTIDSSNCGGDLCEQGGKADLTVGHITGAAGIHVKFQYHGFPTPKPPKHGTGDIYRASKTEAVQVNGGSFPSSVGQKTTMVLTY